MIERGKGLVKGLEEKKNRKDELDREFYLL